MAKYRKQPVVVDAMLWDGVGSSALKAFMLPVQPIFRSAATGVAVIPTLEGDMYAQPGDWIIKGIKGEFYPCKPDIFAATYEPVE
jgi:hypothetical protein